MTPLHSDVILRARRRQKGGRTQRTRGFRGAIAAAFVLVVAMAAASSVGGAAPSRTTEIEVTLTGTLTGAFDTRCVSARDFAGRGLVAPPLGLVRFNGRYTEGCIRSEVLPEGADPTSVRSLEVVLELRDRQHLVLTEDVSWPTWVDASVPLEDRALSTDPPRTWRVDSARSSDGLAGYTGSGAYSVEIGGGGGPGVAQVMITLTGELTRQPGK